MGPAGNRRRERITRYSWQKRSRNKNGLKADAAMIAEARAEATVLAGVAEVAGIAATIAGATVAIADGPKVHPRSISKS